MPASGPLPRCRPAAEIPGEGAANRGKTAVFVDETGLNTAMTPTHAWARRGERAEGSVPSSWGSTTVIAALAWMGRRRWFSPGDRPQAFQTYVDQVLVPELRPGDVVVFDNLEPHLSRHVAESIERAGATVLPLPPYSSDSTRSRSCGRSSNLKRWGVVPFTVQMTRSKSPVPEGMSMVKAVVSRGEIRPLEPLPADWQEGQPLRVEKEDGDETPVEEIDRDFAVLASLCAASEPANEDQLERALREARRQAKEQVRRQMGLA